MASALTKIRAAYEKFLAEHNVPFPNFRDPTKKISEDYGTSLYPETYIIDADGRIERKISGQQDWDSPELVSYIESLLPTENNFARLPAVSAFLCALCASALNKLSRTLLLRFTKLLDRLYPK